MFDSPFCPLDLGSSLTGYLPLNEVGTIVLPLTVLVSVSLVIGLAVAETGVGNDPFPLRADPMLVSILTDPGQGKSLVAMSDRKYGRKISCQDKSGKLRLRNVAE